MIILTRTVKKIPWLLAFILFTALPALAQNITVQGTVVDSEGSPIIGASIVLQNNNSVGESTDYDGKFSITAPKNSVLVVSYIGMKDKEVAVVSSKRLTIKLDPSNQVLEEVVVVGYGQQKKASVVGAITQASAETLQRTVGQTDIGNALTGNLPGVITTTSTGMPGEEEPQIVIRSASSWNNSEPLVLVDGIERPMSSVDMNSVANISVLKDASATAVYGVKGANGVILITTKRGSAGKAKIDVSANYTIKAPSYLPNKLDSYDYLSLRNRSIEHELAINPGSWDDMTPQSQIDMYRNQTTLEQKERYPNVDWQKELFKDFTTSYTANLNVSGGNDVVKYFASADYIHEGDLYKSFDTGRNYVAGYNFDRLNVRSNLDFQITKTTTFKMNISGSTGEKKAPWNMDNEWEIAQSWAGLYSTAPNVFIPIYSDGYFGYYPENTNIRNSVTNIANNGIQYMTTSRINTDFILHQNLNFITKGLSVMGSIAWDNVFTENRRGIDDAFNQSPNIKWINPETGETQYYTAYSQNTGFYPVASPAWTLGVGQLNNWATQRNMNYRVQANWARKYDKHDLSLMGLVQRSENAYGSGIPSYREDWAFRATYNYDNRYFIEYNGAYNGSEKFAPEYRFAFFNSGAVGWMISEEKFIKDNIKFLDMLKLRASYGEIGDDNINQRWLYMSTWGYGGNTQFTTNLWNGGINTPYTWYREATVGNPDIHWETVKKFNFGIDYSVFEGVIAGSVELFHDTRTDILVQGGNRAIPPFYGVNPPTANLGEVVTSGYEVELRLNKRFKNGVRLWGNFAVTGATNTVLDKDDPALLPDYQKAAGYSIGQTHSHLDAGFCNTYDALYGSPQFNVNDAAKLPGDYYIIDFNADGIVDTNDSVPYGHTGTPSNTYNATFGFEWKNWSAFAQVYGVTNVNRSIPLNASLIDKGDVWSPETADSAEVLMPRWMSTTSDYSGGTESMYDASYIRLRNLEVAYTFSPEVIKGIGFKYLKLYINGNNIWSWSRMPDDRESNFSSSVGGGFGAYPTFRRYNFGVRFSL